jgi:hypothetical protein
MNSMLFKAEDHAGKVAQALDTASKIKRMISKTRRLTRAPQTKSKAKSTISCKSHDQDVQEMKHAIAEAHSKKQDLVSVRAKLGTVVGILSGLVAAVGGEEPIVESGARESDEEAKVDTDETDGENVYIDGNGAASQDGDDGNGAVTLDEDDDVAESKVDGDSSGDAEVIISDVDGEVGPDGGALDEGGAEVRPDGEALDCEGGVEVNPGGVALDYEGGAEVGPDALDEGGAEVRPDGGPLDCEGGAGVSPDGSALDYEAGTVDVEVVPDTDDEGDDLDLLHHPAFEGDALLEPFANGEVDQCWGCFLSAGICSHCVAGTGVPASASVFDETCAELGLDTVGESHRPSDDAPGPGIDEPECAMRVGIALAGRPPPVIAIPRGKNKATAKAKGKSKGKGQM